MVRWNDFGFYISGLQSKRERCRSSKFQTSARTLCCNWSCKWRARSRLVCSWNGFSHGFVHNIDKILLAKFWSRAAKPFMTASLRTNVGLVTIDSIWSMSKSPLGGLTGKTYSCIVKKFEVGLPTNRRDLIQHFEYVAFGIKAMPKTKFHFIISSRVFVTAEKTFRSISTIKPTRL